MTRALKVTGEARYPADVPVANPAYAVPGDQRDRARVAFERLDLRRRAPVPGVLDILTHREYGRAQAGEIRRRRSVGTSIQSLGPEIWQSAARSSPSSLPTPSRRRAKRPARSKVSYAKRDAAATFGSRRADGAGR